MLAYAIRRLLQGIIVIILVTLAVFFAIRLLPGDPIYVLFSPTEVTHLTQEQIDRIKHEAGLDKPLTEQYFIWMGGLLHGDFGKSVVYKTPVSEALIKRIPITFHLGILSFILGLIIGIPAGVITAIKRGTWLDTVLTSLTNIGICIPVFWLGVMLIYVFAIHFKLLPVMGYTSPFDNFWMSTKQIIMPVICIAIWPVAANTRQVRSVMLEVLRQDYIRTAWSKGLKSRVVIVKHALKNGLIPIVTFIGLGIPTIIGGSVMIEMVFNIPGMGRLAVESLFKLDYAYVQGVTLIITGMVVLTNIVIDLTYGWLDPRVRYE